MTCFPSDLCLLHLLAHRKVAGTNAFGAGTSADLHKSRTAGPSTNPCLTLHCISRIGNFLGPRSYWFLSQQRITNTFHPPNVHLDFLYSYSLLVELLFLIQIQESISKCLH